MRFSVLFCLLILVALLTVEVDVKISNFLSIVQIKLYLGQEEKAEQSKGKSEGKSKGESKGKCKAEQGQANETTKSQHKNVQ
jgi:hypothetical protein